MFWKTVLLAFLCVGAFADELEITQSHKDTAKLFLSHQCKTVNAEDKVEEVFTALETFVACARGLVNLEELKTEIDLAKPNGALDEVFKKYCDKTPQLKNCIHTLSNEVKPCLDERSKSLLPSARNGTDRLIDFVCYKDGDRIALFISEGGPECFSSKRNAIRGCVGSVPGVMPTGGNTTTTEMTLRDKCTKFDELSACIVKAVEGCDTPTPSNMAESLFRYIRKNSPCDAELPLKN